MTHWTEDHIGDLAQKTIIVTGANSGIGYEAARAFAQHGARVILACRDSQKGERSAADIRHASKAAQVTVEVLDLSSLASIRAFAERMNASLTRLDVLVNNAGVMALPKRLTQDGFEMQLGTNHFGHFALTGLLLDRLRAAEQGRVVTVSSTVHHTGRIRFSDLQSEKRYHKWTAYSQSKVANLFFTFELQRRLKAHALSVSSIACHPGYASTNLQLVGPQMEQSLLGRMVYTFGNQFLGQSAAMGALPTMYAAVSPDVASGDYIGPGGLLQLRGYPTKVKANKRAYDPTIAARLWDVSENLTGVHYRF